MRFWNDVFNRVELLNVRGDLFPFRIGVTETPQSVGHGAIHDLQHASAREQLVLNQRDIRFDAGGVAIHQKRDGPGWSQHGHLCVPVTVLSPQRECLIPALLGRLPKAAELLRHVDVFDSRTVQFDDPEH